MTTSVGKSSQERSIQAKSTQGKSSQERSAQTKSTKSVRSAKSILKRIPVHSLTKTSSKTVSKTVTNPRPYKLREYAKTLELQMKTPSILSIDTSLIPNAGLGVFARLPIKGNTYLGTYEGEHFKSESPYDEDRYSWEVFTYDDNGEKKEEEEVYEIITSQNKYTGNWTRYVNGSATPEVANLIAKQYYNTIEYWSIDDIDPKTELLIYYGEEYNRVYNIK